MSRKTENAQLFYLFIYVTMNAHKGHILGEVKLGSNGFKVSGRNWERPATAYYALKTCFKTFYSFMGALPNQSSITNYHLSRHTHTHTHLQSGR